MKAKTVSAILAGKFKSFLKSITDERVRKLVEENTIITGGSIVSLLTQTDVSDYDLYFRNKETALAVAHYYVAEFKKNPPKHFKKDDQHTVEISVEDEPRVRVRIQSAGIIGQGTKDNYQYFETLPSAEGEQLGGEFVDQAVGIHQSLDDEPATKLENGTGKYGLVFMTANAITLANKIQLILRFYGEPAEIHNNYDFVHCMNYWTSWDKKLVLKAEALEAILTKELRYVGSLYPICSIIRTRKFLARGWHINAGQYLKMCFQVSKLDLCNIATLEEQLIGVDAAYFGHLIDALQQAEDPTKLDANYVMTVIDKIF